MKENPYLEEAGRVAPPPNPNSDENAAPGTARPTTNPYLDSTRVEGRPALTASDWQALAARHAVEQSMRQMTAHDSDFLQAVASDPWGFLRSVPSSALALATAPGQLAYQGAADVMSQLAGQPEYGGNLAVNTPEEVSGPLPVNRFLARTAETNPRLTIAAKVGRGATEMAPLAAVGALPAGLQKLAAGGFALSMLLQAPAQFDAFAEEYYKPKEEQDPDKLTSLWSDVIQTGVFAPLAGAGAVAGMVGRAVPSAPGSRLEFAKEGLGKDAGGAAGEQPAAPAQSVPTAPNPYLEPEGRALLPQRQAEQQLSPTPESPATLAAQIELTKDPASSKAVTLITPGETVPENHGLTPVETAQGTALVNPAKVDPAAAKAQFDAGQGTEVKPGSATVPVAEPGVSRGSPEGSRETREPAVEPTAIPQVLQTKDASGTPIQDEVVTPQTLPAAVAAAKKLTPEATSELKPAEAVIAERVEAKAKRSAKPKVETAPQAEARMQEQVDEVAKSEGTRPAREIKSELVQRLEEAIGKAPEKVEGDLRQKSTPRVTIEIPGDGTFTVINDKLRLEDVLKKAKSLETSPEGRSTIKRRGLGKEDSEWVRQQFDDDYARQNFTEQFEVASAGKNGPRRPVAGRTVTLQASPNHSYFVNRSLSESGFRVTEKVTGMSVGKGPTEAAALKAAEENITKVGEPRITEEIEAWKAQRSEQGRVAAFGAAAPRTATPRSSAPLPAAVGTPGSGVQTAQRAVPTGALRQWLTQRRIGFQSIFAPQSIDAGARTVANILREELGTRANNLIRADEAMRSYRDEFDRTPVSPSYQYDPAQPLPHNYAVMDAFERNRAALPARYQDLAKVFDAEFDWRIKEIQKYAPQALRHLIANYFPHIWKDPARAGEVMAQIGTKLFAGRKEFLKQRTLPVFVEGLARGLEPRSDNPVDLLLAKMHSMDKFITALRAQDQFKAIGKMKFKYVLEPMPEGWRAVDDPSFIVHVPPRVTVAEAYDSFTREKLLEALTHIGVSMERLARIPGHRKALGVAIEKLNLIQAKIGASEDVLWHELGHHLDWKYPDLRSALQFRGNGPLADQLRALVDLNHPKRPHDPKRSHDKYLRSTPEKMAEIFRAYVHAPDLFQRTAPDVLRVVNDWLVKHPDIRGKLDAIKPGMEIGMEETVKDLGGVLKMGDWIMPEGPAAVLRNYLSPGLAQSGAYRTLRSASNLLNGAQLGLSAFHVGFTSLDAMVNGVEIGLWNALHGHPLRAGAAIAKAPFAPIANYYTGKAIQTAMKNPSATHIDVFGIGKLPVTAQARAIGELAVKGGLRATVDPFWQTHFTRRLLRAIHGGSETWAKTPLLAPMALIEQTMRPIAEYLVPRQKLGVFAALARTEMERIGPHATAEQVREAMAKAADYTEDRMGQMTYDNLFYHRMAKDTALLAFRAYGWQLGKYRHLTGALADTAAAGRAALLGRRPDVTHRMAYFVALPVTVAAIGGMLNYLLSGQAPQSLQDYLHPRTGQKDAHGREQRLSLPSYLKDLESDYAGLTRGWQRGGPLGATRGLFDATYHRANPWIAEVVDMLNNKDFYGTEIYHADDPTWEKMMQQAGYIAKSGVPFSITGAQRLGEAKDAGIGEYVLPFIGITPAKRELTMTPAESLAAEITRASLPVGSRTQAQADHSKLLREISQDMKRRGGSSRELHIAAAGGKVNEADLAHTVSLFKLTPLQYQVSKMDAESAMRVWDMANPRERAQLKDQIIEKLQNAEKLDAAARTRFIRQVLK